MRSMKKSMWPGNCISSRVSPSAVRRMPSRWQWRAVAVCQARELCPGLESTKNPCWNRARR